MSAPADKPASNPKPANLRDKKRSQGRFRERELARAARAARVSGAERLELDPESGKYSIFFTKPGRADAVDQNPWDEVLTNAADEKRPA